MPFVNFPMKLFAYDSVWNKIYPGWRFEISIWNSAGSRRSEIEIEFGFSLITELPGELLAVAGGVQMTSFVELPSDENKTTILDSYARVFQNWNKIYPGSRRYEIESSFCDANFPNNCLSGLVVAILMTRHSISNRRCIICTGRSPIMGQYTFCGSCSLSRVDLQSVR